MRDIATTRDFYIHQLGFELVAEFPDYLILKRDRVDIHFFSFPKLRPEENYGQVYIRTEAIEAF